MNIQNKTAWIKKKKTNLKPFEKPKPVEQLQPDEQPEKRFWVSVYIYSQVFFIDLKNKEISFCFWISFYRIHLTLSAPGFFWGLVLPGGSAKPLHISRLGKSFNLKNLVQRIFCKGDQDCKCK